MKKIITELFFTQCFVWFRVHYEKFQIAQQRGFDRFKVQSGMFLTFVLQTTAEPSELQIICSSLQVNSSFQLIMYLIVGHS